MCSTGGNKKCARELRQQCGIGCSRACELSLPPDNITRYVVFGIHALLLLKQSYQAQRAV